MIDWSSVLQVVAGLALVWLLGVALFPAPPAARRAVPAPEQVWTRRMRRAIRAYRRSHHG
jgi:hypothetical protein